MSKFTLRRVGVFALPLALAAVMAMGQAPGQEKESAKPAAKAEKKAAGRLPPYYGEVVSKEQREKIYAVQAKYAEQIEKLLLEVETLEKQQMSEIEGVLSQEQRDQVAKRVSDAKSKRSKRPEKEPAADATK
jgi:hypothetical protein